MVAPALVGGATGRGAAALLGRACPAGRRAPRGGLGAAAYGCSADPRRRDRTTARVRPHRRPMPGVIAVRGRPGPPATAAPPKERPTAPRSRSRTPRPPRSGAQLKQYAGGRPPAPLVGPSASSPTDVPPPRSLPVLTAPILSTGRGVNDQNRTSRRRTRRADRTRSPRPTASAHPRRPLTRRPQRLTPRSAERAGREAAPAYVATLAIGSGPQQSAGCARIRSNASPTSSNGTPRRLRRRVGVSAEQQLALAAHPCRRTPRRGSVVQAESWQVVGGRSIRSPSQAGNVVVPAARAGCSWQPRVRSSARSMPWWSTSFIE